MNSPGLSVNGHGHRCQADSQVRRERLAFAPRWTSLTHAPTNKPEGFVELHQDSAMEG